MKKDLDYVLFRAWLRYLKAETAEEDELPMKPDRSNYREVSCEVPVLFTEANDYGSKTYNEIAKFRGLGARGKGQGKNNNVKLEEFTKDADNGLIAALLHTISKASFADCRKAASKMTPAKKKGHHQDRM